MLHGCDAIEWRVRSCEIQVGIKDPLDLKELKCFRWMLSDAQLQAFEGWNREAIMSSVQRLKDTKATALEDVNDKTKEGKQKRKHDEIFEESAIFAPPLKDKMVPGSEQGAASSFGAFAPITDSMEPAIDTGLMSFFGAKAL